MLFICGSLSSARLSGLVLLSILPGLSPMLVDLWYRIRVFLDHHYHVAFWSSMLSFSFKMVIHVFLTQADCGTSENVPEIVPPTFSNCFVQIPSSGSFRFPSPVRSGSLLRFFLPVQYCYTIIIQRNRYLHSDYFETSLK